MTRHPPPHPSRPRAATADPGLRGSLAAILILALTLAGLGRGLAASGPDGLPAVAGVPICHSGAGEGPADPAAPARHGCCDECALLAAAVLPAPHSWAEPAAAARPADPARDEAWTLAPAPARDHRLPRGPPAA